MYNPEMHVHLSINFLLSNQVETNSGQQIQMNLAILAQSAPMSALGNLMPLCAITVAIGVMQVVSICPTLRTRGMEVLQYYGYVPYVTRQTIQKLFFNPVIHQGIPFWQKIHFAVYPILIAQLIQLAYMKLQRVLVIQQHIISKSKTGINIIT